MGKHIYDMEEEGFYQELSLFPAEQSNLLCENWAEIELGWGLALAQCPLICLLIIALNGEGLGGSLSSMEPWSPNHLQTCQ